MFQKIAPDPQQALREVYEACSLGKQGPTGLIVNGAVLNAYAPAPKYDPTKAYLVSAAGVSEAP